MLPHWELGSGNGLTHKYRSWNISLFHNQLQLQDKVWHWVLIVNCFIKYTFGIKQSRYYRHEIQDDKPVFWLQCQHACRLYEKVSGKRDRPTMHSAKRLASVALTSESEEGDEAHKRGDPLCIRNIGQTDREKKEIINKSNQLPYVQKQLMYTWNNGSDWTICRAF